MTLTSKDVAEITRLLEDSSFDELHLELDGLKLTLRRGSAAAVGAVQGTQESQPASPPKAAAPSPRPPENSDASTCDVTAPMLGTFYRAPKPGAPPFVEVGSRVEEDTIVCIIEVMKLMHTVRAGVRGTVTKLFGRDGTLVEYGEALLRIARDE